MSLSPGGVPRDTPVPSAVKDPRDAVIPRIKRGARWFLIIGVLSGVNAALQIFGLNVRFIFGLGITQVVDAAAHGAENGTIIMVVVDGLFILMLVLCSKWAKTGSRGAFLAGMIAYALDGVMLLMFAMLAEAAVHAYALFMIWQGYSASRELAQMQSAAQPGLSQPNLP